MQERIVDTILPSIGRGSVTEYDIPMSLSREEDDQTLVKKEDLIERETNLDQRTSPINMSLDEPKDECSDPELGGSDASS